MKILKFLLFLLLAWPSCVIAGNKAHTFSPDTTIIPFEYKQSALYQAYTMEVIDSIVYFLIKNDSVTISIDGYAHTDEGSDTITKYLSLNRALFIKDYILGRGIDSSRIVSVKGLGKTRQLYRGTVNQVLGNCRAEIILNFPVAEAVIGDSDKDGLADDLDLCPDEYGPPEEQGCPVEGIVIIPFERGTASLHTLAYKVIDSLIIVLKDTSAKLVLSGHAHNEEGPNLCDRLSKERLEIVKNYMLSRYLNPKSIKSSTAHGCQVPLNGGRNSRELMRNFRVEARIER